MTAAAARQTDDEASHLCLRLWFRFEVGVGLSRCALVIGAERRRLIDSGRRYTTNRPDGNHSDPDRPAHGSVPTSRST